MSGVYPRHSPGTRLGTIRASGPIRDDGDTLNLDLHAGASKVGDGDERAPGVVAVGELLLANLDEPVAVTRLLDEDRHCDEIRERAASAPQRLVDQREHAKLPAMSLPSPSTVAVWPASQTMRPPSVTTAG